MKMKLFNVFFAVIFWTTFITFFTQHSQHQTVQETKPTTDQSPLSTKMYTCPMHPEVKSDKPGECPKCGMNLMKVKETEPVKIETTQRKQSPVKKWYICTMHPDVRLDKPGKCPICGMPLVEARQEKELTIPQDKLDLYGIKLSKVKKTDAVKTINIVGNFDYNEKEICEITTKSTGWIKQLYMNFEGAYIQKNHKLAKIYSPELGRLHTELIFYKKSGKEYIKNLKNTIEHFKHLGISDKEIKRLVALKKPTYYFWIDSPCEGIITKKYIFKDSYINEGEKLYNIVNLKNMWFFGRLYESDIQILSILNNPNTLYRCPMHHNIISKNQGICQIETCHMPLVPFNPDITITIKHPLLASGEYSDYVDLIYPEVEEETRSLRFRMNVPNNKLMLRKGMFANAQIKMKLKDVLIVPETAIVFGGDTEFVFVYTDGKIIPHKVLIGEKYIEKAEQGEQNLLAPYKTRYFQILAGINENDTVITSGTFLIDAESQLRKVVGEMQHEHE